MSKISAACLQNFTDAQFNNFSCLRSWIAGREYYRAQTDLARVAIWDAQALSQWGDPGMSDGNAALDQFLAAYNDALANNTPGWDSGVCAQNWQTFACFSYALAVAPPSMRQDALALLAAASDDAATDTFIGSCPAAVDSDPAYSAIGTTPDTMGLPTSTTPPTPKSTGVCPAGQLPNPTNNMTCETPPACGGGRAFDPASFSCILPKTPAGSKCAAGQLQTPNGGCAAPPSCPAGQIFNAQAFACQAAGGTPGSAPPANTLGIDQAISKINWGMVAGIGLGVAGLAAVIGAVRAPERVLANPAHDVPAMDNPDQEHVMRTGASTYVPVKVRSRAMGEVEISVRNSSHRQWVTSLDVLTLAQAHRQHLLPENHPVVRIDDVGFVPCRVIREASGRAMVQIGKRRPVWVSKSQIITAESADVHRLPQLTADQAEKLLEARG